MNSHLFAQYLVNSGKIEAGRIGPLLKKASKAVPSFAVRALREFKLSPAQAEDIMSLGEAAVAMKLVELGVAESDQLKDLIARQNVSAVTLIQVLLDEKIFKPGEIAAELKAFDKSAEPIRVAVEREAGGRFEMELDIYREYVKVFVAKLIRMTGEGAVIVPSDGFDPIESLGMMPEEQNCVSQRIGGDEPIVAGIAADDENFTALAVAYSREDIQTFDEMAVDSVTELLNVMNGLYAADLANRHIEADLDVLRSAQMMGMPQPEKLILKMVASYGTFYLIVAPEQFLPPTEIF